MVGASLCFYFFAILLNGSQSLAEETTPSTDTTANDTTSNESKSTVFTSNVPSQTSDATTPVPNDPYTTEAATRKADVTPVITKAATKRELGDQDKRATRNINEFASERPNKDYFNVVPIARYVPNPTDNVDDVIGELINRPEWHFKDDREDDKNDTYRRANNDNESNAKKPTPSYFGKLTGGLVIPALKARQRFGDAWTKTSDGFKNVGSGTYDAAAGAYDLVKDSASAVLRG